MSLDRPYFDELRRRQHPAARWWRIGDSLYYLGLITAFVSVAAALLAVVDGLLGRGWHPLAWWAGGVGAGIAVFLAGCRAKRRAYELGERDGITPTANHNQ